MKRPTVRSSLPYWPWAVLGFIVVAFVYVQTGRYVGGNTEEDIAGYAWIAEHLRHGRWPVAAPAEDTTMLLQYQSHVWVNNPRGETAAKYAPGFPLWVAALSVVCGDEALYLVSPIAGAGTLIAAFVLFRQWTDDAVALAAVVALAGNGMFLFYTNYPLAHAAELFFVTAGMAALWAYADKPTYRSAAAAGLLLGFAVLIRHVCGLLGLVVLAALLCNALTRRDAWRTWLGPTALLGAAYLAFPVVLMFYQRRVYGGVMTSGYDLSDEGRAFAWSNLVERWYVLPDRFASDVMPALLVPAVLGLLIAGPVRDRVMRGLWVLPIFLLYGSYYWFPPGFSFHRFNLVVLPALVGAAFVLLNHVSAGPAARAAAAAVLAAVSILAYWPAKGPERDFTRPYSEDHARAAAIEAFVRPLPVGTLLLADDDLFSALQMRWDFDVFNVRAFDRRWVLNKAWRDGKRERPGEVPQPRWQPDRANRLRAFAEAQGDDGLTRLFADQVSGALVAGRTVAIVSRRRDDWPKRLAGEQFVFEPGESVDVANRREPGKVTTYRLTYLRPKS